MSVITKEFNINKIGFMRAVRQDMTIVGDGIAKRWYKGPNSEHTIIMQWGKIKITPTFGEPFEVASGAFVDWPAGSEYEVSAVEVPVRYMTIFCPNLGLVHLMQMSPRDQIEVFDLKDQLASLHEGV